MTARSFTDGTGRADALQSSATEAAAKLLFADVQTTIEATPTASGDVLSHAGVQTSSVSSANSTGALEQSAVPPTVLKHPFLPTVTLIGEHGWYYGTQPISQEQPESQPASTVEMQEITRRIQAGEALLPNHLSALVNAVRSDTANQALGLLGSSLEPNGTVDEQVSTAITHLGTLAQSPGAQGECAARALVSIVVRGGGNEPQGNLNPFLINGQSSSQEGQAAAALAAGHFDHDIAIRDQLRRSFNLNSVDGINKLSDLAAHSQLHGAVVQILSETLATNRCQLGELPQHGQLRLAALSGLVGNGHDHSAAFSELALASGQTPEQFSRALADLSPELRRQITSALAGEATANTTPPSRRAAALEWLSSLSRDLPASFAVPIAGLAETPGGTETERQRISTAIGAIGTQLIQSANQQQQGMGLQLMDSAVIAGVHLGASVVQRGIAITGQENGQHRFDAARLLVHIAQAQPEHAAMVRPALLENARSDDVLCALAEAAASDSPASTLAREALRTVGESNPEQARRVTETLLQQASQPETSATRRREIVSDIVSFGRQQPQAVAQEAARLSNSAGPSNVPSHSVAVTARDLLVQLAGSEQIGLRDQARQALLGSTGNAASCHEILRALAENYRGNGSESLIPLIAAVATRRSDIPASFDRQTAMRTLAERAGQGNSDAIGALISIAGRNSDCGREAAQSLQAAAQNGHYRQVLSAATDQLSTLSGSFREAPLLHAFSNIVLGQFANPAAGGQASEARLVQAMQAIRHSPERDRSGFFDLFGRFAAGDAGSGAANAAAAVIPHLGRDVQERGTLADSLWRTYRRHGDHGSLLQSIGAFCASDQPAQNMLLHEMQSALHPVAGESTDRQTERLQLAASAFNGLLTAQHQSPLSTEAMARLLASPDGRAAFAGAAEALVRCTGGTGQAAATTVDVQALAAFARHVANDPALSADRQPLLSLAETPLRGIMLHATNQPAQLAAFEYLRTSPSSQQQGGTTWAILDYATQRLSSNPSDSQLLNQILPLVGSTGWNPPRQLIDHHLARVLQPDGDAVAVLSRLATVMRGDSPERIRIAEQLRQSASTDNALLSRLVSFGQEGIGSERRFVTDLVLAPLAQTSPQQMQRVLNSVLDGANRPGREAVFVAFAAQLASHQPQAAVETLAAWHRSHESNALALPILAQIAGASDNAAARRQAGDVLETEARRPGAQGQAGWDALLGSMRSSTTGVSLDHLPRIAALALNQAELANAADTNGIIENLSLSARQGHVRAMELLAMMATGRPAQAGASQSACQVAQAADRAATALQQCASQQSRRGEVMHAASHIFSQLADNTAVNPANSYLLTAIRNIEQEQLDRSVVPSPQAEAQFRSWAARMTGSAPSLHSSYGNQNIVPVLARVGMSATDPQTARVAHDHARDLWLLCGDRAAVVHQLVDIYRNFGDRHGTALQTIANIATGGTAYDGVGPQSRNGTSYREPMMREAVQLLRQEMPGMVERMGSTSEAERQSALTAFNAVLDRLNGLSYPSRTSLTLRREIIETVQQQLSALQQNMTGLGSNPQAHDLYNRAYMHGLNHLPALIDRAPQTDRRALNQDVEQFLTNRIECLPVQFGAGGNRASAEIAAQYMALLEMRSQLQGRGSAVNRDVIDAISRMSSESQQLMFNLAPRLEAWLNRQELRNATSGDVNNLARLAGRLANETNLSAADRQNVRQLVDHWISAILTNATTNTTVRNQAFEFFRSFGWSTANDTVRGETATAVNNYVQERIRQNPNDWQFQAAAAGLTDLGQAPRLEALLRNLGVPGSDARLEQLVRDAVQHYGDAHVRQALINLSQWQAMSPTLRGAIVNPALLAGLRIEQLLPLMGEESRLTGVLQSMAQAGGTANLNPLDLMRTLAGESNVANSNFYGTVSNRRFVQRAQEASASITNMVSHFDGRVTDWSGQLQQAFNGVGSTAQSGPGLFWWNNVQFTADQNLALANVRLLNASLQAAGPLLGTLRTEQARFQLSCSAAEYAQAVGQGRRSAADDIAVQTLRRDGLTMVRAYAGEMFNELHARGPLANQQGILARMHLSRGENLGPLPAMNFQYATAAVWHQALESVEAFRNIPGLGRDLGRDAALEAMRSHPDFNRASQIMMQLGPQLQEFHDLFSIGSQGAHTEQFRQNMQGRIRALEASLSRLEGVNVQALLTDLNQTLERLGPDQVGYYRQLTQMRNFLLSVGNIQTDWAQRGPDRQVAQAGPALSGPEVVNVTQRGERNGQIAEMFRVARSSDFDASTAGNWMRNNGGRILLEVGITALLFVTTAGVGNAVQAASWGARAAHMALSAARLGACMTVANIGTNEAYRAFGGAAYGHPLGEWARGASWQVQNGQVVPGPTMLEALGHTGWQFAQNTAMSLALMGFGEALSLIPRSGQLSPAMMQRLQTLETQLASAPEATRHMVREFFHEYSTQLAMTAQQEGISAGLDQAGLGESWAGMAAAFLLTAGHNVAARIRVHRATGHLARLDFNVEPQLFMENLRRAGFTIAEQNGSMILQRGGVSLFELNHTAGSADHVHDGASEPGAASEHHTAGSANHVHDGASETGVAGEHHTAGSANHLHEGATETGSRRTGGQSPASSDLVPYIGDARFTVPMYGQVTLDFYYGQLYFSDGPQRYQGPDCPVVLHRTESGWQAVAGRAGFDYLPHGSTEFRHIRAGRSVTLTAGDRIRLGRAEGSPILSLRPEQPRNPQATANAPEMQVTSLDTESRDVEIFRPGRQPVTVRLYYERGWFVGPETGPRQSPVYVSVADGADLARVQPVVIEALITDPVLTRLVTFWRTMDPARTVGEDARAMGVAPTGNRLRGFTIYCRNAEDASLVQQRLSEILAQPGLSLPAPVHTDNVLLRQPNSATLSIPTERLSTGLPPEESELISGLKSDHNPVFQADPSGEHPHQSQIPIIDWSVPNKGREAFTSNRSWAIPDDRALRAIRDFVDRGQINPQLVEIGAGTGYWCSLLQRMGVDVHPYDHAPITGDRQVNDFGHRRSWLTVACGGPEAAAQYGPGSTLFLCWPPHGSDMAVSALRQFRGNQIVYIGENVGGCTANQAFHDELDINWRLVRTRRINSFDGTHDEVFFYVRRQPIVAPAQQ